MDNQETLATLGTQDTVRRQTHRTEKNPKTTQHRKLKRLATQIPLKTEKISNTDPTKNRG